MTESKSETIDTQLMMAYEATGRHGDSIEARRGTACVYVDTFIVDEDADWVELAPDEAIALGRALIVLGERAQGEVE